MAAYRAEIFGTEKDDKNCSFYMKVGACRHGDECQKLHVKPMFSRTVLLKNFYLNPNGVDNESLYNDKSASKEDVQSHFDNFYEDVFVECEQKYGYIVSMNVCENANDHLSGNVYIKFIDEQVAMKAVTGLNSRWFGGKPIYAELSPVTDLNKAFCQQHKYDRCPKGRFCNFLHVKRLSPSVERYLYGKNIKRPWVMNVGSGSSAGSRTSRSSSCSGRYRRRSRRSRSRSRFSKRRSRKERSRSCRSTSRSCSSIRSSRREKSRSCRSISRSRSSKRRSRRERSRSCRSTSRSSSSTRCSRRHLAQVLFQV